MSALATAAPTDYSATVSALKKVVPTARQITVNLDDLWVDRTDNVRHSSSYTEEDVTAMADDIKTVGGLLQPIGIYPIVPTDDNANRQYALAYGFRRTLGLQRLAESEPERWGQNIPAILMDGIQDKATLTMVQLMENLSRKNLNPLEKAIAMKTALDDQEAKLAQQDVAKMLNISPESVSQHLRLLELPESFQEALVAEGDEKLSFSNARTILYSKLPNEQWNDLLKEAIADDRQTFINKVKKLEAALGGKPEGDGDEAPGTAAAKAAPQRTKQVLRAAEISGVFVPFLKQELSRVKDLPEGQEAKYTLADLIQARLDTLNTVTQDGDTQLGIAVKPFKEAQEKQTADEEAKEKAEKAQHTFWKEKVKDVEAILNAELDPTNISASRPTPGEALATVVKRIYSQQEAGKLGEIGFTLPAEKKDALQVLMDTLAEVVADRIEKKAKAKKAKEEKDAKEAEAKAHADAAAAQSTTIEEQAVDAKTDA